MANDVDWITTEEALELGVAQTPDGTRYMVQIERLRILLRAGRVVSASHPTRKAQCREGRWRVPRDFIVPDYQPSRRRPEPGRRKRKG